MSIQITAGRFGRRKLLVPKGEHIRPSTTQLRAAVCNILSSQLDQAHVLDLFAGSGAMGLEMLSQGAAHVDFVESHPLSLSALRTNREQLSVEAETTLYASEVFQFLPHAVRLGKRYTILFADPPYVQTPSKDITPSKSSGTPELAPLARLLLFLDTAPQLMQPGGIVLFEQAKRDPTPLISTHWRCTDRRVYGDSALLFWTLQ